MRNPFGTQFRLGGIVTILTVFASLFVAATPAQAYNPDPTVYWMSQDSGTCGRIGATFPQGMIQWGRTEPNGPCFIEHPDVYRFAYEEDPNSNNLYLELWAYRGGWVGTISFEAYGEKLYVVDESNDGDTFYVWIDNHGPYYAPGTDNETDAKLFNLSLADGSIHNLTITDDKAGDHVIDSSANGSLPFVWP